MAPLPYRLKVGCSDMQVTTTRCPDIDKWWHCFIHKPLGSLILSFIYEFVLLVKALPRDFSSSPTAKAHRPLFPFLALLSFRISFGLKRTAYALEGRVTGS